MATTLTDERTAIESTVQLYIDGASKGEPDKLKEAFHETAWMFGSISGQRFDMPIAQMIETITAQPLDATGDFAARITSVEQVGDAATVRSKRTAAGATSPSSTSSRWRRSTARGRSSTRRSPTPAGRCRRARLAASPAWQLARPRFSRYCWW